MRIFNKDKTEELFNCDSSKGYTIEDKLITHIKGQKKIEEKGHYRTIKEYENGGKDVEWIIDIPSQEEIIEHDESEDILIYTEYTKDEIKYINNRSIIAQQKYYLQSTDYIVIKMSEKKTMNIDISDDLVKYNKIITKREECRNKINILEKECSSLVISDYVREHY